MPPSVPLAALLGFASALHCAAMCGGFTLLASASARARSGARTVALARLAALHAGRLFVYVFLGSACGAAGRRLLELGLPARALAAVAGAALLVVALERLGLLARAPGALGRAVASVAARLRDVLAGPSLAGLFGFGMANGLLPCAATAAALALAAGSGSAGGGALTLLAFGAATLPTFGALALLARAGRVAAPRAGGAWSRVASLLVLALALVTLWRGGFLGAGFGAESCCAGSP